MVLPDSFGIRMIMGESPKKSGPDEARQRVILKQQCEALERIVKEGEKLQTQGVAPISASYRNIPMFAQPRQEQSYTPYVARSYFRPPVLRQPKFTPYRYGSVTLAIPRAPINNAHHRVWKKSTIEVTPEDCSAPSLPQVSIPEIILATATHKSSVNVVPPPPELPSSSNSRFTGPIRPIVRLNSRARFRLVEDHIAAKLRKEEQDKRRKSALAAKEQSKQHSPSRYRLDRRIPSSLAKSVTLGGLNLAQRRSLLKNPRSRLSSSFSIQRFSLQRKKKLSITELDLNSSSLSQQRKAPIRLATRFVKQSKKRLLKKKKNEKACVFFMRTGICRRKEEGKCPFQHDPIKRLLCQRYLKTGTCDISECALSHDKETGSLPPLCRFFKRGRCSKTADECPFSHSQEWKLVKPRTKLLKDKEEHSEDALTQEEAQGRYFEMHPDSQPEEAVIPRRLPKGCTEEISVKSKVTVPKPPESSSSSSSEQEDEVVFLTEKRKPRPAPAFIGFRS